MPGMVGASASFGYCPKFPEGGFECGRTGASSGCGAALLSWRAGPAEGVSMRGG
jgi:hypothetical protein